MLHLVLIFILYCFHFIIIIFLNYLHALLIFHNYLMCTGGICCPILVSCWKLKARWLLPSSLQFWYLFDNRRACTDLCFLVRCLKWEVDSLTFGLFEWHQGWNQPLRLLSYRLEIIRQVLMSSKYKCHWHLHLQVRIVDHQINLKLLNIWNISSCL